MVQKEVQNWYFFGFYPGAKSGGTFFAPWGTEREFTVPLAFS